MAVAVVERFKQVLMYGLSAGTKKSGLYREVAVVERWPLVEVRLYLHCTYFVHLNVSGCCCSFKILQFFFL